MHNMDMDMDARKLVLICQLINVRRAHLASCISHKQAHRKGGGTGAISLGALFNFNFVTIFTLFLYFLLSIALSALDE